MNVEYTGRHYESPSPFARKLKLASSKSRKSWATKFETKVILAVEKHRHKAEIHYQPRNGRCRLGPAGDMIAAVTPPRASRKTGSQVQTRWRTRSANPAKAGMARLRGGCNPQLPKPKK